jgi:hypothetical protein
MVGPPSPDPQSPVVREASAFLWTVLERAGSPSLRDAATMLYPGELTVPKPESVLRHMLLVAVAILCDSTSVRLTSESATLRAAEGMRPTDVVQSAERVVAAVEQGSLQELAEAHAYFLAPPPWSRELVEQQPLLTDLAFGVVRFMIECALECAVNRGLSQMARHDEP